MRGLEFGHFGVAASDWQETIDFHRMRQERNARAQAAMKKHGVAACLLTIPQNVRYATGVHAHSAQPQMRYALVFAEHDPVIYEYGDALQYNMAHCPWVKPENWRYAHSSIGGACGPEATWDVAKKWAAGIVADLKQRGLAKEKLGVDAADAASRQALKEAGIETVEAAALMREARRVKTRDEVNCMRMACAIANAAFSSVMRTIRPDTIGFVRENDVSAEATSAVIKAGSDAQRRVGIVSGPRNFDVSHHDTTDRIIQPGDLLYVRACAAAAYMGYMVCYYRSFVVGRKPNQKEKDFYKRLHERLYSVIAAVKPGATTADAAKYFLPASTWGYEADERLITAEVGHGRGIVNYEEPIISRIFSFDHPQVFEPGMIIAIEGREGEIGYGGVRFEEMIVVTETGNEIITTWPSEEIIPVGVFY